jgi:biotin synthase
MLSIELTRLGATSTLPACSLGSCRFMLDTAIRHDWTRAEVAALFALPFNELLHRAHGVHRQRHDPNAVQVSTLLSIKTGGCPEDCAYCPQAARYDTGVQAQKLMSVEAVLERAQAAKDAGASRFCMGAAWRGPKDRDVVKVAQIIRAVKGLGLETCATLGMLTDSQAQSLKDAGLDYYNHNLDTAPEFYGEVIQTRQYQDRLDTLEHVRAAGMKTCCGGIVGMGESPICPSTRSRCRSTSWWPWRGRRWAAPAHLIRSSLCAPSRWPAC